MGHAFNFGHVQGGCDAWRPNNSKWYSILPFSERISCNLLLGQSWSYLQVSGIFWQIWQVQVGLGNGRGIPRGVSLTISKLYDPKAIFYHHVADKDYYPILILASISPTCLCIQQHQLEIVSLRGTPPGLPLPFLHRIWSARIILFKLLTFIWRLKLVLQESLMEDKENL
jgi:hypothetical protein